MIDRTLASLSPLIESGAIEVVVACNACTDDTAAIARQFNGVEVLELERPSKTAALNAAESVATLWPRLYLDADITVPPTTLTTIMQTLSEADGPLAVRAPYVQDLTGASALVRRYYRARSRLGHEKNALWGAGAFALNEAARVRFGEFPDVVADDLYVDSLFSSDEKVVPDAEPVVVRCPRDTKSLLAIIRRSHRGTVELSTGPAANVPSTASSTVRQLVTTARSLRALLDAAVYAGFAVAGRGLNRWSRGTRWERDDSSRTSITKAA